MITNRGFLPALMLGLVGNVWPVRHRSKKPIVHSEQSTPKPQLSHHVNGRKRLTRKQRKAKAKR